MVHNIIKIKAFIKSTVQKTLTVLIVTIGMVFEFGGGGGVGV